MYGLPKTHEAGWTEDRVGTLKKLWLEGLSASQIAKSLKGGVTRNAVIAKVHRLGLSGRAGPSQPARTTVTPTKPRQQRSTLQSKRHQEPPTQPVPQAAPASNVPDLEGTAIIGTLGAHMCKWPIGDPSATEFSFCGRKTEGKDVYCIEHARVAYQPHVTRTSRPSPWMY